MWSATTMAVISGNDPAQNFKDCFLNTLSLIVYVKGNNETCKSEHIKKEKILKLSSDEVNSNTSRTITAVIRALSFVQLRCGITSINDLPYKLMLVVLAYYLEDDNVWSSKKNLNKLEYWYWVSLMGGAYFTGQNQQCCDDILDLKKFIDNDVNSFKSLEDKVLNKPDYATKEILLRKADEEQEPSSVKAAILSFILRGCPKDFIEKREESVELSPWAIANQTLVVELHHVIPLGSCTKLGESSSEIRKNSNHPLNSCLNLTYITKDANRAIRDKTPQDYIKNIVNIGAIGNFLPQIKHFESAVENNNYEVVLEERFVLIKNAIIMHIDSLK